MQLRCRTAPPVVDWPRMFETTVKPPQPRVCVVGSLNMDLVIRAPRIPTPGETVLGGAYRAIPGGKGANQAVAAARMGAHVSIIGCIGDDPHGMKLRQTLEGEPLDLSRIITRAGEATGLALITVAEGGENTIVVSPGANATLTAEDVVAAADAIRTADVLLMQLEVPSAAVMAAARIAREAGKGVILNAAPARVVSPEFLRLVDVLVVNRVEAGRLLQMDPAMDPARLALRLPELGPPTAVLTLGVQGAVLNHRGRPRRVPTPAVQAVDAVGAGDALCGVLAACWPPVMAAGRSLEEMRYVEQAVLAASVAGALATTKAGAIPSLPSTDEVAPYMRQLKIAT